MSAPILVIDGYNLLHAAGMAQREYRPGDLLRCRTRLLKLLHGKLSAAEIKGTTVVFDARDPPPDRPAQVVVSGIRVLFAKAGGDADALIQDWLFHHPAPRRVTLVSSDRALQRAARSSGAKFIGSHEFLDDLGRRRGPSSAISGRSSQARDDEKPAHHASPSQTAYWLKVFGDAPIVEPDPADEPAPRGAFPGAASAPPATAKTQAPRHTSRPPRHAKRIRAPHDVKPSAGTAREELDYWIKVFSGVSSDSAASSPEELRLADLERWVKELDRDQS
jgi:predicted RNA-binding protein with PIN domain